MGIQIGNVRVVGIGERSLCHRSRDVVAIVVVRPVGFAAVRGYAVVIVSDLRIQEGTLNFGGRRERLDPFRCRLDELSTGAVTYEMDFAPMLQPYGISKV